MAVGKIIEVVASSKTGWEDAAQEAIREAGKTVRGITGIDIQDWTAKVKDGKIIEYRVNAKIVFGVEKT
jgi:dodecin